MVLGPEICDNCELVGRGNSAQGQLTAVMQGIDGTALPEQGPTIRQDQGWCNHLKTKKILKICPRTEQQRNISAYKQLLNADVKLGLVLFCFVQV